MEFKREKKYVVLKVKDINKYLTTTESNILATLCTKIHLERGFDNKRPYDCVVVEHDWPMYETVWKLIKDWVENNQ